MAAQRALNVTIDGMNTQDNMLKSSDGYFSYIMPSVDALEEVHAEHFGRGRRQHGPRRRADSLVTKSGTNTFHGAASSRYATRRWMRITTNNQVGLPRDIVHLWQYGGHLGGLIIKNKLFFFWQREPYRYPGTPTGIRKRLHAVAASGIFDFMPTPVRAAQRNLLQAAAANGSLPAGVRPLTTIDPIFGKTPRLGNAAGELTDYRLNTANGDWRTPRPLAARRAWTRVTSPPARSITMSQKHHVSAGLQLRRVRLDLDF